MVISIGNNPCRYSDCIYYHEGFTVNQYRGLDIKANHSCKFLIKCSKCRHMIHHIKYSKKKELEKIDRFEPIKIRIKADKRLVDYLWRK